MSTKSVAYNFFAVSGTTAEPVVERIKVEQAVAPELVGEFTGQRDQLFEKNPDRVPFTGTYRAEEGELLYIDAFALPAPVSTAVEHPLSVPPLRPRPNDDWDAIHAIVAARWNGGRPEVIAQTFDRRRVLEKQLSLVITGDTFSKLTERGLILDKRVAAVVQDGQLFFRSFADARRVFDLGKWYREATDADVEAFTAHRALAFESSDQFMEQATETWVRRRIAVIADSKLLDVQKPADLARKAKKYKLAITVQKGRLVIPGDKKVMKDVLRFLEENYFTSDLTGKQYLSNSKRPVE